MWKNDLTTPTSLIRLGVEGLLSKVKKMNKDLLFRDGLLYIVILLVGFGTTALETNFYQGLIALLTGAVLVIARTILKERAANQ